MSFPGTPRIASRAALVAVSLGLGASALAVVPACSGGENEHGAGRTDRSGASGAEHGRERSHPSEPATPPASSPSREEPVSSARVVLEPPGQEPVTVRVEVARTPAETQRGLMFRRHMDPDAGMIFLFARPRQMTFWMHNTYIPLDMVFIQSDMRVLGVVENAPPETDDPREVPGISQFVLEVNAGFAREHGISAGTMVHFEGIENVPTGGAPIGEDEEDEEWEDE